MNKKRVTFPFVVWTAAAAISPLYSQSAGFQIGQTQPAQLQNAPAPSTTNLIAPIGSPIQPTANPILPLVGTNSLEQKKAIPQSVSGFGNGAITILPPGGIVFVPAGTMVIENGIGMEPGTFLAAPSVPASPARPGSPGTPQTPATPPGGGGGGTSIDRSNRATNIGQQASPPDVTRLALGTSRDKVIEKYGNPIAFIMNMNGETLYFRGGVVVFIKDGVVAVPTVSDDTTRR
jgi:hypothetical protein